MQGKAGAADAAEVTQGFEDARQGRPAAQTWGLLWELALRLRTHAAAIAAELDLTPMQMFTLKRIEPNRALPMHALADLLLCDASNVTGLVDKLEARGLIKRRPDERDRRVKMLVLTDRGVKTRQRCLDRMLEAPPAIAALPAADQKRLREDLTAVLAKWALEDGGAAG